MDILSDGEHEQAYEQAKARCLRILNARDRTSHELLERLDRDGYQPEIAESVVARLIEIGLVDDERYTEFFLLEAQASHKGWYRVKRELEQKGIDVESLAPPDFDEELQRALAAAERLVVLDQRGRERALRRLVSKGFSYEIALKVLDTKKGNAE